MVKQFSFILVSFFFNFFIPFNFYLCIYAFYLFFLGELDVFSDLEDTYLLAALRTRRFNFKETRLLFTRGAEWLEKNREYFKRVDTEIVRRVIASKAVVFLPYRDARGRPLALAQSGKLHFLFRNELLKTSHDIFSFLEI